LCTASAAEIPEGLTAEEWQLVQNHRKKKKSEAPSASSARKINAVARVPDTTQEFRDRTEGKTPQERFALVYRNNNLSYVFGRDPALFQDLSGVTYSEPDSNSVFRGLFGALRLRESLDGIKSSYPVVDDRGNISFNSAENPQAQEEDKAANFGWTRDGTADAEIWKGKGALYLPMVYISESDGPFGTNFQVLGYRNNWNVIYPAVRFERDSSKDGTDAEVNTLDFLVGWDMNFVESDTSDAKWLKDTLGNLAGVVRFAAGVRTTFDFDHTTWLTEVNWLPVDKDNAINAFLSERVVRDVGQAASLPALNPKVILKAFSAATQSRFILPDNKDSLEDVVPLGFEAGFAIRPGDITSSELLRRLELSATYRGQWDVINGSDYHGLLDISLSLPFVEGDTTYAGWKVSYKRGDDLTSYEELDELSIGLEVKF
jgi:hypothetical protein